MVASYDEYVLIALAIVAFAILFYWWWTDRAKPETINSDTNDSPTDEQLVASNICPECRTKEPGWVPGPEGGMCQNFWCAACGARFNMSIIGGTLVRVERTAGPDAELAKEFTK